MKNSSLTILLSVMFLGSCNVDRLIRKNISNNDINICWFYYSYISDNSPDFVVVMKNNTEIELIKADFVISNVNLVDSNIIIKLYKPYRGIVYTKQFTDSVFGYKIIIDSTTSNTEFNNMPKGVKHRKPEIVK